MKIRPKKYRVYSIRMKIRPKRRVYSIEIKISLKTKVYSIRIKKLGEKLECIVLG